jgi:hypothetical protein
VLFVCLAVVGGGVFGLVKLTGRKPQQSPYNYYGQPPHEQPPHGAQAPRPPDIPNAGGHVGDVLSNSVALSAAQRNTAATWALILGIAAMLLAIGGGVGGLVLIPGVVTGVRGLRTARGLGGIGHGKSVAGLVMCAIAAIITVAWLIAFANRSAI